MDGEKTKKKIRAERNELRNYMLHRKINRIKGKCMKIMTNRQEIRKKSYR